MPGLSQPKTSAMPGLKLKAPLSLKQTQFLGARLRQKLGGQGGQENPRKLEHFGNLAHSWAPMAKSLAPPGITPPSPRKIPFPQPAGARQTMPPLAAKPLP
jgi:hypothetical protein